MTSLTSKTKFFKHFFCKVFDLFKKFLLKMAISEQFANVKSMRKFFVLKYRHNNNRSIQIFGHSDETPYYRDAQII